MAMYGNGVTRGRVARLGITAAVNQACAALATKNGVDPWYLYQYLAYRYEDLRNLGHGAHQKNLSAALLKQFPVALPTFTDQEAIARILEHMDRLVETEAGVGEAIANTLGSTLWHLYGTPG
jgi:type I restriction enzyme S subunit